MVCAVCVGGGGCAGGGPQGEVSACGLSREAETESVSLCLCSVRSDVLMADPCVAAMAVVCAAYYLNNSSESDTPPTGWAVVEDSSWAVVEGSGWAIHRGQAPAPTITWL